MADLTDEQCDDFRRLPGSFNDMVRAIYRAGRESTATPPADAALADVLKVVECQLGHAADVSATYVAFTRDETMQIRAALRAASQPQATAVPEEPTVPRHAYEDCIATIDEVRSASHMCDGCMSYEIASRFWNVTHGGDLYLPPPDKEMTAEQLLMAYELETRSLPPQAEIASRGCSQYNWQISIIRELRAMLAASKAGGA